MRGAKEVLGQAPVSCLAEEIATPGDGQLKALITVAGNPVLSTPGGDKLDEALPMLEAMISVDLWLNETTRHADVILPGLSPLEQPHHDDLILQFAIHSIANYSAPVFDPGDRPHEWEILIRLTGLCTGTPAEDVDVAAIDDGFFDYLAFTRGVDGAADPQALRRTAARSGCWTSPCAPGRSGTGTARTRAGSRWTCSRPIRTGSTSGRWCRSCPTSSAPPTRRSGSPRNTCSTTCRGWRRAWSGRAEPLVLVSRRHLRSNNSWMHNVPALMKGKDRCTLLIHPDDAARYGVADNDVVTVKSAAGEIKVPVEVTDEIMPGVVSMPHGWGHGKPGTRMSVANGSPGANTNALSPPTFLDEPSGNGALNGIPVTVIEDRSRFRPATAGPLR